MKDFKIVFVDSIIPISKYEKEIIEGFGCTVTQYNAITPQEILEVAADADAIMTCGGHFKREAIEGLTKCKVIARYGQGYDNVDVKAATEKGIVVTYVPVYCQEEVATLALTLMLACERKLLNADKAVKSGHWASSVRVVDGARSVRGRTIGLVGLGSIQKRLVGFLKPFGVKMISYDPYINQDFCKENDIEPVDLDTLLKTADDVFLQVPLTDETRHMIGARELSLMKSDAVLINTGRGALVDQLALTEALKNHQIAAAGLDVLEFEPPTGEEEIFKLDNVITSGHIGAATADAMVRLRQAVAQSVVDVLDGKKPSAVANPEVLEKVHLAEK